MGRQNGEKCKKRPMKGLLSIKSKLLDNLVLQSVSNYERECVIANN